MQFSIFIFSFLWHPLQKIGWFANLYSVFIFNILKKWIWIQKTKTPFYHFHFLWKWIQWHFHNKTNYMGPTSRDMSPQLLSLSLSLSLRSVLTPLSFSLFDLTLSCVFNIPATENSTIFLSVLSFFFFLTINC